MACQPGSHRGGGLDALGLLGQRLVRAAEVVGEEMERHRAGVVPHLLTESVGQPSEPAR